MTPVLPFDGAPLEWDGFVRRQAGWTHFHLHGWRDVIRTALGHETIYLAARTEGALTGVLPLVRVRSALFGHYLVSMPFVNYGGPLGELDGVRALSSEAARIADESGAKLLELRSPRELPLDLSVSHRKLTVVLDLPGDADALMRAFPAKLRSQVRRPEKEGVTYAFGLEQVTPFHRVFARHMRDLGTPAQGRGLFEEIARVFPNDAWFGCAWLGGRPIAAGAGFRWGTEFELTWASSLSEFNRTSANMGLYHAFMVRAIDQGCARFNFGRCTPGSSTHRYKLQWGGRDEPLWWYQHAPGGAPVTTPSPDQGAYSWGPRFWRQLPLWAATALGPRVVRYIP
jgi:FemAB-related protein (PEP-CTERM system-associated)